MLHLCVDYVENMARLEGKGSHGYDEH